MSAPIIPSMALGRARTAPVGGGAIFTDDFDDVIAQINLSAKTTNSPVDQGGWQTLGTVTAANAIICDPAGSPAGSTGSIRIRRNTLHFFRPVLTWTEADYYVQIVQNTSSPTPYGLFVNYLNETNHTFLLFTKGSATGVQVYDAISGVNNLLFEGDASAYPDGVDTLTRIEARGATVNIFIDGLQFGGDIATSQTPAPVGGLMTTPLGGGSSTIREAGDNFEIGTL